MTGPGVSPGAVGPGDRTDDGADRAARALSASGIEHTLTRHGRVGSLAEAAAARGVEPRDIVKTLVVRRAEGEYLFVLVPGDCEISWPKLRAHLGVNRISMPDAAVAREVTGYERGTITPFGSRTALPVVADATMTGRMVSVGAGDHGVAATLDEVGRRHLIDRAHQRRLRHVELLREVGLAHVVAEPPDLDERPAGRRRYVHVTQRPIGRPPPHSCERQEGASVGRLEDGAGGSH